MDGSEANVGTVIESQPKGQVIYTACGISTCFVVGYLASVATSLKTPDLSGLTIYTLNSSSTGTNSSET